MRWERMSFMGVDSGLEYLRLTAREKNHLVQAAAICEKAREHYEHESEEDHLLAYAAMGAEEVLEQLVDQAASCPS